MTTMSFHIPQHSLIQCFKISLYFWFDKVCDQDGEWHYMWCCIITEEHQSYIQRLVSKTCTLFKAVRGKLSKLIKLIIYRLEWRQE